MVLWRHFNTSAPASATAAHISQRGSIRRLDGRQDHFVVLPRQLTRAAAARFSETGDRIAITRGQFANTDTRHRRHLPITLPTSADQQVSSISRPYGVAPEESPGPAQ